MSKQNRDGFVAFVEHLKSTLGTLNDDQQERLRQKARKTYGLTAQEAEKILEDLGIKVVNYFEVLGLTIAELENYSSEETVKKRVEDAWFPLYDKALKDHTNRGVERRNLLNKAKNTLIKSLKRRNHIGVLTQESESTEIEVMPDVDTDSIGQLQSTDTDHTVPEISSHNTGLKVFEGKGYFDVVIPKMTPIPCEVNMDVSTTAPNQDHFMIEIYQGLEQDQLFEEIADPEAFKLGDCLIKLPPKLPKGSLIKMTFKMNADQILEVTAEVPDGSPASVMIERPTLS